MYSDFCLCVCVVFSCFTGHELAFAAFLCCLFKVGALTEQDAPAAALKVFER